MGRIATKCFITDKMTVALARLEVKTALCSRRSHLVPCVLSVPLIGCTRVASVQSEPGQQNLLIQPPLGRKRGLRQVSVTLLTQYLQRQLYTDPLFGSCVAPCCPSPKMNHAADRGRGSRRPAGASSPRTSHLVICVHDCECLLVEVSGSLWGKKMSDVKKEGLMIPPVGVLT